MLDSDDYETEAALEAGRLLFARECRFMRGVVDLAGLPPPELPEIAFVGRSNVGKSSLINALLNRRDLARTSNTPGRTQELNFFDLDGRLTIVDLPGYGYARVSRSKVEAWTRLLKSYLRGRPNLVRAYVLADSRHGLKPPDREMMKMLDESAVSYQVVLTKIDKLRASEREAMLEKVRAEVASHVAAHPVLLVSSAVSGEGMPLLRSYIAALAAPLQA